jgi:hypothetical protein
VTVRPELSEAAITGGSEVRDLGQESGGVEDRHIGPGRGDRGNDITGLRQMRGAGHVGDDAARTDGVDRGAEQPALERG